MLKRRVRIRRKKPLRFKSEKQEEREDLDTLLRQAALLRDSFTCRRCGASPRARTNVSPKAVILQAAHIYGKGAHPAMRYTLDNVLILCKGCHFWWHMNGFGREAATEDQRGRVRAWCVEAIGAPLMSELDLMAGTRRGESKLDLDVARILLEREIKRLTTSPVPADRREREDA